MTSTAVLEIIDLTDSPPPLNDETQKTPIAAKSSADPDPEKNATRAARKRKNGEAGNGRARSHPPVKSRHGSPERSRAQQSGEGTAPHMAEGNNNNGEPKARKKRRSKKNKDKEKDSAPPSPDDTQRDALLTFDDGELFKVDIVPAAVPEDRAFDLSRSTKAAPSSSSQTPRVPLLLPAHVSVLDPGDVLPVQTIQPAESDSDSESYIEYLDYDDRLVRSRRSPSATLNSSLISHRHPTWCAIFRPLRRIRSRRALFANDAVRKANIERTNAPYRSCA
jgi:protein AIR1/2